MIRGAADCSVAPTPRWSARVDPAGTGRKEWIGSPIQKKMREYGAPNSAGPAVERRIPPPASTGTPPSAASLQGCGQHDDVVLIAASGGIEGSAAGDKHEAPGAGAGEQLRG